MKNKHARRISMEVNIHETDQLNYAIQPIKFGTTRFHTLCKPMNDKSGVDNYDLNSASNISKSDLNSKNVNK